MLKLAVFALFVVKNIQTLWDSKSASKLLISHFLTNIVLEVVCMLSKWATVFVVRRKNAESIQPICTGRLCFFE